jgi:5'-phosphate synthase pdxT subunit
MTIEPKTIGILALQGDFEAHQRAFASLPHITTQFVRTAQDLAEVDALVLPGGESTTIGKLMARIGLDAKIKERAQEGMPLFGTCAGLILLADAIEGRTDQPTLQLLPITIARNAFGSQLDSFEADIPFEFKPNIPDEVRGVFIRAPYVVQAGEGVEVVSTFREKVVGVRKGNRLGIAFHPELTSDTRIHAYFAQIVLESTPENR